MSEYYTEEQILVRHKERIETELVDAGLSADAPRSSLNTIPGALFRIHEVLRQEYAENMRVREGKKPKQPRDLTIESNQKENEDG